MREGAGRENDVYIRHVARGSALAVLCQTICWSNHPSVNVLTITRIQRLASSPLYIKSQVTSCLYKRIQILKLSNCDKHSSRMLKMAVSFEMMALLFFLSQGVQGSVQLPSWFGDNMVLQWNSEYGTLMSTLALYRRATSFVCQYAFPFHIIYLYIYSTTHSNCDAQGHVRFSTDLPARAKRWQSPSIPRQIRRIHCRALRLTQQGHGQCRTFV